VERSSGRGRIVENHLTAKGARVLRQATAAADDVIRASLAGLDATDVAQANGFLTAYVAALTKQTDVP
jgi:hypothetical protein